MKLTKGDIFCDLITLRQPSNLSFLNNNIPINSSCINDDKNTKFRNWWKNRAKEPLHHDSPLTLSWFIWLWPPPKVKLDKVDISYTWVYFFLPTASIHTWYQVQPSKAHLMTQVMVTLPQITSKGQIFKKGKKLNDGQYIKCYFAHSCTDLIYSIKVKFNNAYSKAQVTMRSQVKLKFSQYG